ncbi:MAG: type II toxin-antitoxin system RelE/ParE family toxin [Acidobacteria bacterium]|nr:type II toxin-antitoxin system RelE/ParE family toxin [Acidobacteriota bacterium]
MTKDVSLHPLAQRELNDSIRFYNSVSKNLAADLLAQFESASAFIRDNPLSTTVVLDDIRKKRLRRFPFNIIFAIREGSIRILALAHHSRKLFYWAGRS